MLGLQCLSRCNRRFLQHVLGDTFVAKHHGTTTLPVTLASECYTYRPVSVPTAWFCMWFTVHRVHKNQVPGLLACVHTFRVSYSVRTYWHNRGVVKTGTGIVPYM